MLAFGRSLCSVSGSTPSSLVASWCGSLGACLPFFPFLVLWSHCHSGFMDRELERFFPSGCFLFQFLGCPASALAVAGKGGSVLRAHLFFGTVAWCLFKSLPSPLTLPGVVMTFPVCLPRAPALRQVLVAMLAEGALESPSVLVLAFHSSFFLVEGSFDGSAPGDRFPLPWADVFIHSVSVEISRFGAVSTGEWAFLPPLDLSGYCRIQWRLSSRKLLGFP